MELRRAVWFLGLVPWMLMSVTVNGRMRTLLAAQFVIIATFASFIALGVRMQVFPSYAHESCQSDLDC